MHAEKMGKRPQTGEGGGGIQREAKSEVEHAHALSKKRENEAEEGGMPHRLLERPLHLTFPFLSTPLLPHLPRARAHQHMSTPSRPTLPSASAVLVELQLTTGNNLHRLQRAIVVARLRLLDTPHHVHTLKYLAKHHVAAIKPRRRRGRDEELRPVCVGARVCHGERTHEVFGLQVLIGKLVAVDRLATGAIEVREVAALDHEVRDDAVKDRVFVAEPVLACAELPEVLCCERCILAEQADGYTAKLLAADRHIEVHLRCHHWLRGDLEKGEGAQHHRHNHHSAHDESHRDNFAE
ncbi:cyclophilin [Leishmania tarentolae]|uniref:Cyclophilin n=1 Tax=Leishmania tarentolae TaxID=5689 RepID=A0A640K915_LEITA|nr:cyclophilin [Leishmania tarentolae]